MSTRSRATSALQRRLRSVDRGLKRDVEHDADALHRTRVASRRLREALPLLLPGGGPDSFKQAIRDTTRALGAVREMDVAITLVDSLARERPDLEAALALVRADLATQRRTRLDSMRHEIDARRLRRASRALAEQVTAMPHEEQAAADALASRLADRLDELREAVEAAGLLYAPERLHRVRLATKKLRYALELTQEIGVAATRSLVAELRRTQDRLGLLHDLEIVAQQARRTLCDPQIPLAVARCADPVLTLLEDRIHAQHADYLAHRKDLLLVLTRTRGVVKKI